MSSAEDTSPAWDDSDWPEESADADFGDVVEADDATVTGSSAAAGGAPQSDFTVLNCRALLLRVVAMQVPKP